MRNYSVSTYPLKIKTNDDDKHEILKGNWKFGKTVKKLSCNNFLI
jgi:hypothetical protein